MSAIYRELSVGNNYTHSFGLVGQGFLDQFKKSLRETGEWKGDIVHHENYIFLMTNSRHLDETKVKEALQASTSDVDSIKLTFNNRSPRTGNILIKMELHEPEDLF